MVRRTQGPILNQGEAPMTQLRIVAVFVLVVPRSPIGALTGSRGGVGKGAVVGTAAGTGVVLLTKGKEVQLPQGAHVAIRVREAFRL